MRVFVTGTGGQLGHDVVHELNRRGYEAISSELSGSSCSTFSCSSLKGPCFVPLDITDREAVHEVIASVRPDAMIHCAAWTAVDAAEDLENAEAVRKVNADGTAFIAHACKNAGAKMIFLSTDYVFDGRGTRPWQPDCTDFAPLNVYGKTKLEGERAVRRILEKYFIVRTSWVFGKNGGNFVKTMLRAGKRCSEVKVVRDQIGTPTYTADLARLLVDMAETEKYGVYHATNEGGYISWFDFCGEIYRMTGYDTAVLPVTTEEYGISKAARPRNSRLDRRKLPDSGFKPLPVWQDALKRYLQEIKDEWVR